MKLQKTFNKKWRTLQFKNNFKILFHNKHKLMNRKYLLKSVCSENIKARWTWKSGCLKKNKYIPWEQVKNNNLGNN